MVLDMWGKIALLVDPLVVGARRLGVDLAQADLRLEAIEDEVKREAASKRIERLRDIIEGKIYPRVEEFEDAYRSANMSSKDLPKPKKEEPGGRNLDDVWNDVTERVK